MFEYTVRKRTEKGGVKVVAEDGLEAASQAFPDLDFETIDVSGESTHLLDIKHDVIYLAIRGAPASI